MICGCCGETTDWNPFGFCSWGCYDEPRATPQEAAAALEAAPEALAFFMGIGPGERVDGG